MPRAPSGRESLNCCKGGALASMKQDPSRNSATFHMNVRGSHHEEHSLFTMPENFSLGLPGYSCGNASKIKPTKNAVSGGRRWTQALRTWKVTCGYSQSIASPTPRCCVSLSAFYNKTIVPCLKCSCRCREQSREQCIALDETKIPSMVDQKPNPNEEELRGGSKEMVRCSPHMCPISVHWHIKESYTQYWRVKISITNMNILKNYSHWNVVVLHPNMKSLTRVFSFRYAPLDQYGYINESGMFWGIENYNEDLLQVSERGGNVQTEMLLSKERDFFTFRGGWAFPRGILFNGDECVMPQPDQYPRLPIDTHNPIMSTFMSFSILFLIIVSYIRLKIVAT